MTVKLMIVAGALLASTSALAQPAPGTEQTSQDLVCQLSDACAEAAEEEVATEQSAETPAAPSGARVSATRGFKIANKVTAKPAQASTAATTKPKAGATASKTKTAAAPGKGSKAASSLKAAGTGRADLRVSFVTGSAELTEYGQREAQKFAEALKSPLLGGMRFRIEGHTDAVGNRDYNLDLSRRRAQAVVDYLAGKGADRGRFDVVGYGFDKPLPGTAPSSAANRRVEVVRIR